MLNDVKYPKVFKICDFKNTFKKRTRYFLQLKLIPNKHNLNSSAYYGANVVYFNSIMEEDEKNVLQIAWIRCFRRHCVYETFKITAHVYWLNRFLIDGTCLFEFFAEIYWSVCRRLKYSNTIIWKIHKLLFKIQINALIFHTTAIDWCHKTIKQSGIDPNFDYNFFKKQHTYFFLIAAQLSNV